MDRAIVIGCPGSGKSTFARALSLRTGLELIYLDQMYWNADRTHVDREEFDRRLAAALAKPRWIIDGNYQRTLEKRLSACDAVFMFDLGTEECLAGIRERRGRPRPDMPWVETGPDAEFESYVESFRAGQLPVITEVLKQHAEKEIHIFRSRAEADAFLSALAPVC